MNKIRHHRLRPIALLAAALLLRAIVPAGYMPAAAGSGPLFELCPAGVPAPFMQALRAYTAHGHDAHVESGHHDHHGHENHDDHQCPVGHMLLSAAAVDDTSPADAAPLVTTPAAIRTYSYFDALRPNYRSRGPPA